MTTTRKKIIAMAGILHYVCNLKKYKRYINETLLKCFQNYYQFLNKLLQYSYCNIVYKTKYCRTKHLNSLTFNLIVNLVKIITHYNMDHYYVSKMMLMIYTILLYFSKI